MKALHENNMDFLRLKDMQTNFSKKSIKTEKNTEKNLLMMTHPNQTEQKKTTHHQKTQRRKKKQRKLHKAQLTLKAVCS